MERVVKYKAIDGALFDDEDLCVRHERWIEDLEVANEMLESGATVWSALVRANARAAYDWAKVCGPSYEEPLSKLTKDTKLTISHWQSQDTPGYSPVRITKRGDVFVFGDAGSWSGPYGDNVSLKDLCRYVAGNKQ